MKSILLTVTLVSAGVQIVATVTSVTPDVSRRFLCILLTRRTALWTLYNIANRLLYRATSLVKQQYDTI